VTIPFAGLALDERLARGSGEIAALDLLGALDLGQRLRRMCRGATTLQEVAEVTVDLLNSFDHDGRPACVLVRAFVSEPAGGLRPIASRGLDPAWNRVDGATLVGAGALAADLADKLRPGEAGGASVTALHVEDVAGDPAVPGHELVRAYDVRSIFGFGMTLAAGQALMVLAWCRAPVPAATAALFDTVAMYARLAWVQTGRSDGAYAAALEDMVALQERHTADALVASSQRLDELRRQAAEDARAATAVAEAQTRHLHRTQRAMLNLIDDLRQARASLAATVEERTAELAQANRRLEARNLELEEFVYIASHDLQEPLRTVAGYLQMVQRRYGATLGVDADEFIRFAVEGAQRMQALIESLLVYSRVTNNEDPWETLALDEALATAARNLALRIEESGAVIDQEAPLPLIDANRMQMVQLFQNLLSNAIKFSGDKPPRVQLAGAVADGLCTLTFRDDGVGFNPRFAERIFKIFRRLRRDTEGTGIGLAVCKKIVERHGGEITATAAPGMGATFTVRLPVRKAGR
jgi:signal transduction histidine kinase